MIAPTVIGDFQVTCSGDCERPIAIIVGTLLHAERLEAKHWREHHPSERHPDAASRDRDELAAIIGQAIAKNATPGGQIRLLAAADAVLAAGYVKAPF